MVDQKSSRILSELFPLTFLILSYYGYALENDNKPDMCAPLTPYKNIQISCSGSGEGGKTRNLAKTEAECNRPQLVGNVVKYKCKANHIPFDESISNSDTGNQLKCGRDGEWGGMKRYEAFRCKEDCGRINTNAKALVVHGVVSNRTQVPWHATIFRRAGNDWAYICGGTIIRNQIIMSAAHCFAIDHNRVRNPEEFRIILGSVSSTFTENWSQEGIQVHKVQRIHISENYDPQQGYQSDVAIIQLKENIEFNENVVPICLPNDYKIDVHALKSGMLGKVAGFGVTENGKSADLRTLDLKIRSNTECLRALRRVLSGSQFCAGDGSDGKWETACNGDSGGGLYVSSKVHEKYYIHGIVSSGDPETDNGVCKNYAVFTRVYSFIFWIRDVVEEISGEIARDLHLNAPYPYAVRGTETETVTFSGLPREWINRVTSLEIHYASLSTDTLLTALENARPIESINLRNVVLLNGINFERRTVVLPVLASFVLDILAGDEVPFDTITPERTFPIEITESYLRTLVFFDKDFESAESWSVESLHNLNMDIQLTIHIFRILRIGIESGELILQQTALANRIISGYEGNLDFVLRRLALHRCDLDFENLGKIHTLSELILDRVIPTFNISSEILSTAVANLTNLRTFVLNPIQNGTQQLILDLNPLSRRMIHLSMSHIGILATGQDIPPFTNLRKLCCIACELSEAVIKNFKFLFPNLKSIVMETRIPKSFDFDTPHLTSIYINTEDANFIKDLVEKYGLRTEGMQYEILLKKDEGNTTWKLSIPTAREQQHLTYACTKQSRFWTSEEDFLAGWRLKSFEKEAINTGTLKFKGMAVAPSTPAEFKGVPVSIQPHLKSIHLDSSLVADFTLAESVADCLHLRSLTLSNVTVDISHRNYELGRNGSLEFRLERIEFHNFTFHYVLEYVGKELRAAIIPYQHIGRFKIGNRSNVLHHLFWHINAIRLTHDDYILYVLDVSLGEIRAFDKFLVKLIAALPEDHVLRGISENLNEKYATFQDGVLPPAWKYDGLHVIDKEFSKSFFNDDLLRVIAKTGLLNLLLTRLGWFFTTTRATFLTHLETNKSPINFPLIHGIAVNLNEDQVAKRLFPAFSTSVSQTWSVRKLK